MQEWTIFKIRETSVVVSKIVLQCSGLVLQCSCLVLQYSGLVLGLSGLLCSLMPEAVWCPRLSDAWGCLACSTYHRNLNMTDRAFFEIQAIKAPFCFWMKLMLLCHIYHMINNDSITDQTVENNRRSRDLKEPIWNVY